MRKKGHVVVLLLPVLLACIVGFRTNGFAEALNLGRISRPPPNSRVLYHWSRRPGLHSTTALPVPLTTGTANKLAPGESLPDGSSSKKMRKFRWRKLGQWWKRLASPATILLLWTTVMVTRYFVADTAPPQFPGSHARTATVMSLKTKKRSTGRADLSFSSRSSNSPLKIVTASGMVVAAVLGGQKLGAAFLQYKERRMDKNIVGDDRVTGEIDPHLTDFVTGNGLDKKKLNNGTYHSTQLSASPSTDSRTDMARAAVQRILDRFKDEEMDKETSSPLASSPYLPITTVTASQQENEPAAVASGDRTVVLDRQQISPYLPKKRATIRQPLPPKEESALQARYAAIPDLSDRAYQILLDLGMV